MNKFLSLIKRTYQTLVLFGILWSSGAQILNNWPQNQKRQPDGYDEQQDFVKKNESNLVGVPKFIQHPQSLYYVYEDKPVKVECVADPVSHVNIICNNHVFVDREKGGNNVNSRLTVEKLNSQNVYDKHGTRWRFSISISQNEVTEWFNTFTCICEAWNLIPALEKSKKVHSRKAVLKEAFLKRRFKKVPQSTTVIKGQRLILTCVPPEGKPEPKVEWMKNGALILTNDRIQIEIDHKLVIDDISATDAGNYSCTAVSLKKKIISPVAEVKVKAGSLKLWTSWTEWSSCDKKCSKKRSRECLPGNQCSGIREQIADCSESECKLPQRKIQNIKDVIIIVGVFIAVTILVMMLTLACCCLRRKEFRLQQNSMQYPLSINDNNISYETKTNLIKTGKYHSNSSGTTNMKMISGAPSGMAPVVMNPAVSLLQQRSAHSQSPPNLPPPTYLSDVSANNAYSNGIDVSYNSTGSGKFSQPLISNSSTVSNSNKSKTTSSSNADPKIEPMTMSPSPTQSRPTSALYHELSSDVQEQQQQLYQQYDQDKLNSGMMLTSPLPRPLPIPSAAGIAPINPPLSIFPPTDDNATSGGADSTICWISLQNSVGGRIALPLSGISLTVPPGALSNYHSKDMYLAVCRGDTNPPPLSESETLLSPIVSFGPDTIPLLKSCVLTMPHSADLRQGNWVIRVMSYVADSGVNNNDNNIQESSSLGKWKVIATVGCENDHTPIYTHLDSFYTYLVLDRPQKICLTGQSYPGGKATKRLRLGVFGRQFSTNSYLSNYNVRIYVFADTREAFESVVSIERNIGGSLLDNTHQITFSDSMGNLFFCIEELSSGWNSGLSAKYQEVPFQDVWSGSQSEALHCAFTFDNIDPGQSCLFCRITAYQSGFYNNRQTITIRQDKMFDKSGSHRRDLLQYEKVVLHSETNNTYLDPLNTIFRIPLQIRKKLCLLLDKPISRGSDWKQLYRHLGLNGYTNFFLTKQSPTDVLLTLWEARHRNENAVFDLINSLKSIGRIDCANILESDYSSS